MAISNGFQRVKDYIMQADETFKLLSRWTSSKSVEYDDGKTAQEKNGIINGITSDVNCEDPTIAASASMVGMLNSNLGGLKFKEEADGSKWVRGADSVWVRLGKQSIITVLGREQYSDKQELHAGKYRLVYMSTCYSTPEHCATVNLYANNVLVASEKAVVISTHNTNTDYAVCSGTKDIILDTKSTVYIHLSGGNYNNYAMAILYNTY